MPRRVAPHDPFVPLAEADPAEAGGKGANLARLAAAGLPVPRAWILPVRAHLEFLARHGLGEAHRDGRHAEIAARLPELAWDLPRPRLAERLAVRSSATDEDGREHARAGAYRTELDVPPDGVPAAILRCWASWHACRARGPATPDDGGMALVLMEMVDAEVAGVLFTVNPLTGSWAEMVVEACWGLGESLVAGQVVPDRWVMRRPRGALARLVPPAFAARGLRVVQAQPAHQSHQRVRAPQGGTMQVPCPQPTAAKLAEAQVRALCALGLRVEALLGEPQDIEWAKDRAGALVLLQARPVTGRAELPRGGATLWTRRFVGERWPNGATPLGWSLLAPLLSHFVAYPATSARYLGGEPPFRRVRGHPYVNVTVFRHLAFKLPGLPPPRFVLDFFPPEEETRWLRRAAAPPDLRVLAALVRESTTDQRWSRFRWNPVTNPAAWEEFAARLDDRLAALEDTPPEAAWAAAEPLLRAYVGIHVTSLLYANLAWDLLAPWLGNDADVLLHPPEGSITARVNGALRALGALRGEAAEDALAQILAAHGHRSSASWEIWSPRWAEEPDSVLRLARAMAEPGTTTRATAPDPEDVAARLAALPPGLRGVTELARTYLRLREEQRYHLDRILWVLKRKLRALGARWLEDADDVRFLEIGELEDASAGRLDADALRRIVARRAREPLDPDPPDFLSGDAALPIPTPDTPRLQGLGISPGRVRGRVRILRHPEEADRVRPGEILVTRAVDPGWTPVFDRAGGLVLELGSQLSHGAVVAREMRLPAIANIVGATRILRDGEEVTVDGRAGVLWRG
jgi:phosphohistidine swiveling domain-containing protein